MRGLGPLWVREVLVAVVISFAAGAFGQSAISPRTGRGIASSALCAWATPTKLSLHLTPSTWVSEPLYDFEKKKRRDGGGHGVAVPEGGSAFTYLGLAGLVCLGAIFFNHRRRKHAQRSTGA